MPPLLLSFLQLLPVSLHRQTSQWPLPRTSPHFHIHFRPFPIHFHPFLSLLTSFRLTRRGSYWENDSDSFHDLFHFRLVGSLFIIFNLKLIKITNIPQSLIQSNLVVFEDLVGLHYAVDTESNRFERLPIFTGISDLGKDRTLTEGTHIVRVNPSFKRFLVTGKSKFLHSSPPFFLQVLTRALLRRILLPLLFFWDNLDSPHLHQEVNICLHVRFCVVSLLERVFTGGLFIESENILIFGVSGLLPLSFKRIRHISPTIFLSSFYLTHILLPFFFVLLLSFPQIVLVICVSLPMIGNLGLDSVSG